MSNKITENFTNQIKSLNDVSENLESSLNKTQLITRVNYNNLLDRMNTIRFKITDLIDDIEELQYDLDKEDIKTRTDTVIEKRMEEFERTYDAIKPVLGFAMLAYLHR